MRLKNNECTSPRYLKGKKLSDLQLELIKCPYPMKCKSSSDCECFYRPFNDTVEVDCSYRNLTKFPRIEVEGERVALNLVGNAISESPYSSLGYENVTSLLLSNNKISRVTWLPPRIEIIKLDGNQLKYMTPYILRKMNNSSTVELSNNPWTCDCFAANFQKFVKNKLGKEGKEIICAADNKPLIEKTNLCELMPFLILHVMYLSLILIVFLVEFFSFYRNYKSRKADAAVEVLYV
ncbi:protein toll [Leptinotarsa decemlineata]|uniref:protein toll n=1 Tax=Leptinotarsa decemlineata TaxID=7539 RepID=UPI003D30735F